MTQPDLLALAKQGNPKAIAALLNRSLQAKGITAKANLKEDGYLQVMLESSQIPSRSLVKVIRKGLISLEIESIKCVKIYGRQVGQEHPDWHQEFELPTPINSNLNLYEASSSSPLAGSKAETLTSLSDSTERINQPSIQSYEKEDNLLSLRKYTISWIIWGFLSQPLRFGGNLLLTHLLFPHLFGLMALVYVFITGVNSLSDIGLLPSIIQNKRGDDPNFLNTAWTMQAIRGIGLWCCCLLVTLPVANFYEEPMLLWLLPVVGLNTAISGFNSTALLTFSHHMEFRKLTIFYIGVQAVSLTVTVIWAWFNKSVWALVVGGLVSALFGMVWSHRLMPEIRNRFFWEKAAAKSIFSFGKWIFLLTAVTFLAGQVPKLILGKLVSLEMLGVYDVAFSFASGLIALALIQGYSDAVIFPFFSKQAKLPHESLRAKIMQPRWLLLVAGTVLLTILIGFGDILIKALYDNRYREAAWMLPILSLGLWPTILSETINPVLFAVGRPRYAAFGRLLKLIVVVVGLLLGLHLGGFVGAVIAVALSELPVYGVITYGAWRERVTVIEQDIRATALLIGLLSFVLIGRVLFGLGLPPIHV